MPALASQTQLADSAHACAMQVACHNAAALRRLLFSCIRRRLVVAQGLSSPPGKAAKEKPAKRKSVGEKTPQKVRPRLHASPLGQPLPPHTLVSAPVADSQLHRMISSWCHVCTTTAASTGSLSGSQKKQRLVKAGSAGSTEKGGRGKMIVEGESSQLEDLAEEKPESSPSARKPQHPQKQRQEPQTADSDEDDSAPVITGYFPCNRHTCCTVPTIKTSTWNLWSTGVCKICSPRLTA